MKEFLENARQEAPAYGPLPFWSWNDKLEEGELRRQIRRMHELGMNGFFMHARGGLKTPYMGAEWFSAVRACVDEARRLGMEAWAYDENGWPSGFAGGALLKDPKNLMLGIAEEESDIYPAQDSDLLGVYILSEGRARRVTAPEDGAHYYILRRQAYNSYTDTLDPNVAEQFLEATHAVYRDRLEKDDFGTVMPGFFTDEPEYNRWSTPYSDILPETFLHTYDYPLWDGLICLFEEVEGYREFRYDYYLLCGRLFMHNFVRPIAQWCQQNGCRLTGHGIEEFSLTGQVMCCGSVMPLYVYEDMPGIDYLSRPVHDDLGGRQLGSVCAQFGKKKALSEMYGCCGWDVSPRELKRLADSQYVNGVNIMCQHLYPYSEHGQRKRDYPAHYSEHLPWQNDAADLWHYFTNLGCLLSRGEEEVRTLLIHPIHAAYMTYTKKKGGWAGYAEPEEAFMALIERLSAAGLPYHLGEEDLLVQYGRIEGDAIYLGQCRYDRVILPEMDSIDTGTADMLRVYLQGGGRLALAGAAPTRMAARKSDALDFLRPNITVEEILATAPVRFTGAGESRVRQMVRRTDVGRLIYLVNTSALPCPALTLEVDGAKTLVRIDIDTLEPLGRVRGTRRGDTFYAAMPLDDSEGVLLLQTDAPDVPFLEEAPQGYLTLQGHHFTLPGPVQNTLTLDRFSITRGDGAPSPLQPIEQIREELLLDRYAGEVTLRTTFTVEEMPTSLALCAETNRYDRAMVNGQEITWRKSDRFPLDLMVADILPYVHAGENEILLSYEYFQSEETYYALYEAALGTLRNCIAYDGEVECLYLCGDFSVRTERDAFQAAPHDAWRYAGHFALTRSHTEVDPSDLTRDGYPFFSGALTVQTDLLWQEGDPTVLSLPGHYAVCHVAINGQDAGKCFFSHRLDVAPYLVEGENTVTLTLISSNRNLLGPFHDTEAEPFDVHPRTFSQQGQWKNGHGDIYVPTYALVRFGLDV